MEKYLNAVKTIEGLIHEKSYGPLNVINEIIERYEKLDEIVRLSAARFNSATPLTDIQHGKIIMPERNPGNVRRNSRYVAVVNIKTKTIEKIISKHSIYDLSSTFMCNINNDCLLLYADDMYDVYEDFDDTAIVQQHKIYWTPFIETLHLRSIITKGLTEFANDMICLHRYVSGSFRYWASGAYDRRMISKVISIDAIRPVETYFDKIISNKYLEYSDNPITKRCDKEELKSYLCCIAKAVIQRIRRYYGIDINKK